MTQQDTLNKDTVQFAFHYEIMNNLKANYAASVKVFIALFFCFNAIADCFGQTPNYDSTRDGFLVFHPIKTDPKGFIIPWAANEPGAAYDSIIHATWNFWIHMRRDYNGLPYYLNHQVWRPVNDSRGIGGDQFAMALDSWQLLYQYTGDEAVRDNMKLIADYYLTHSLSTANAAWPNIPFPYNTLVNSGFYDGDMVLGGEFTQPDKAGSFAWELIKLFKATKNEQYLQYAIRIANTLAEHTRAGTADDSPLPFKVNAYTGVVGVLKDDGHIGPPQRAGYTTNFSGTLELFFALDSLKQGHVQQYQKSAAMILEWMNKYPLASNRWGPFFEDVHGWSDTQINAVTYAFFIMRHPSLYPRWRIQARQILDWVYGKLGNDKWKGYGVRVINEQTAYPVPGNSHTARQAVAELLYASLSADTANKALAIRQLNWASYSVNSDGKNCYPKDEIWLTDGYGDYIRHFLHAMAAFPDLAPSGQNHILSSSSIISKVDYRPNFSKDLADLLPEEIKGEALIRYETFDKNSVEIIRLSRRPSHILFGKTKLTELQKHDEGNWIWKTLANGEGIAIIHHFHENHIIICN